MAAKSQLTKWAEISQIASAPLAIIAIILAVIGLIPEAKRPPWLPMLAESSALFNLAIGVMALAIALVLASGVSRLKRIEDKLSSEPTLVIAGRTSTAVSARLGERELELEPAAADYYRDQLDDVHREKINGKIRRHPMKMRWTKRDFVMEVDEKARVRITLDDFIGSGNKLLDRARDLVRREAIKSPPSLADLRAMSVLLGAQGNVPAMPMPVFEDLARWEADVYKFLKEETHGHAEDFMRAVDGLKGEVLADLVRTLEVRIDRLASIKSRIG